MSRVPHRTVLSTERETPNPVELRLNRRRQAVVVSRAGTAGALVAGRKHQPTLIGLDARERMETLPDTAEVDELLDSNREDDAGFDESDRVALLPPETPPPESDVVSVRGEGMDSDIVDECDIVDACDILSETQDADDDWLDVQWVETCPLPDVDFDDDDGVAPVSSTPCPSRCRPTLLYDERSEHHDRALRAEVERILREGLLTG